MLVAELDAVMDHVEPRLVALFSVCFVRSVVIAVTRAPPKVEFIRPISDHKVMSMLKLLRV